MDSETRKKIGEMVLRAYTLDECLRAEESLRDWLRDHPEDLTMYELARSLATVKAAALEDARTTPQKAAA